MNVSRLVLIWFILLDSCQMLFMHEIDDKFFALNNRPKNKSFESITYSTDMRVTPRLGGTGLGGVSYLAISLLFQMPLMEIIFVMGLIILVLGIILHFVELKADFFRLRRQFLREERLRMRLEEQEALRNQTLALQGSNSSFFNGVNGNSMNGNPLNGSPLNGNPVNGNPVNGALNQNYGSDDSQSYANRGNYENNRYYGQRYREDKLYAQSSQSYPSRHLPPNGYPQRLLRRPVVTQLRRTNSNLQIPQNINQQKLIRRRGYPQRVVAVNRRQGLSARPLAFRRRVGKK